MRGRQREKRGMDIARWREIYKVIEQRVREDTKKEMGKTDILRHQTRPNQDASFKEGNMIHCMMSVF